MKARASDEAQCGVEGRELVLVRRSHVREVTTLGEDGLELARHHGAARRETSRSLR